MLRLTLSQLRHGLRRLVAAGLAIAIGAAFVAATLTASDVLDRASVTALSAGFGDADLIAVGDDLDPDVADDVAEVPGVAAVHASLSSFVQLETGGTATFVALAPTAVDPALQGAEIVTGRAPGAGEVVLPVGLADRLGIELGDDVPLRRSVWGEPTADAPDGTVEEVREPVAVVGLLRDPAGFVATPTILGDPEEVLAWASASELGGAVAVDHLALRTAADADLDAVSDAVATATGTEVTTRDAYASARAAELTGGGDVLAVIGLAFGAVALLVSGLVIANTFSVVVAQRTRMLALLRCVGANARQLRRSVLLEATCLGVLASLVGIAAGLGLAQATVSILGRTAAGASLPATIAPGLEVLVVPLAAGVLVTAVAALVPARAASRVAPLAALRPADGDPSADRVTRRRRVVALALAVPGVAMLLGGMTIATGGELEVGLLVAVLGGALSFVGVLVGAALWVPRAIGLLAAAVARGGQPTAALAAANAVRNPKRTAATTSALLIGVTLVAMMSSGASIARASFDQEFGRLFPVDIEVLQDGGSGTRAPLPSERVTQLAALDEIAAAVPTGVTTLRFATADGEADLDVTVVDPSEAATAVRGEDQLAGLRDDVVVVPATLAENVGLGTGGDQRAVPLDAVRDPIGQGGTLEVATREVSGGRILATPATVAALGAEVDTVGAWLRIADGVDTATAITAVQDAVADDGAMVTSAAAERDTFDQVVTTLLRVVIGLLAVAVVIALVGVANTLSLSVIERGRESATLRAIGLTRRQLRRTLAIEAALIAGSGAVLGTVLGTVYGYVGSRTVLGELADGVPLAVPWLQFAALVAVAVGAGVVASILPGRRAARTPPVQALATE